MKLIAITWLLFFCICCAVQGQQVCIDSSYRMKFTFDGEGATLYNNPDVSGYNYFTGQALRGQAPGLAILKTNWGDSIIWAKKIFSGTTYLSGSNSIPAPNGSFIFLGNYGGAVANNPELLICRMDTNGIVMWVKKYRYYNQKNFGGGGKNFLVTNDAIYFIGGVYTFADEAISVIAKLDLNGNILWSTGLSMNIQSDGTHQNTGISGGPVLLNNHIVVCGDSGIYVNNSTGLATITRLNETDGTFVNATGYKTINTTNIIGILPLQIKNNNDNTYTLTGQRIFPYSGFPFLKGDITYTQLDTNLNPLQNYYFQNNILNQYDLDNNNKGQQVLLATDGRFGKSAEKYFFTFSRNYDIIRSRKFIIPNYFFSSSFDMKLDDKQNLHFAIGAIENNKPITDYARISNFAPNSNLGCFGKDTSLLNQVPFSLVKKPFAWDKIEYNVLTESNVPFTIQDAIVTKQLICKIVSYCDTVKINGPATACVNQPVRYTVKRNNTCFKNTDWNIDTTFVSIVTMEGDSAITLSFKKPFSGYLHAALSDCVVKDSFFIKAVTPSMPPLINRTDSLLCPGKTLTLTANNGYTNYNWQGGTASSKQLTATAPGMYRITALDSCNNPVTDSIAVTLSDTSMNITASQTICLYDSAFITLPASVNNITWQPAVTSLLRNKTIVAYPAQTTLYTITAQRQNNCPISRISLITVKPCPQTFYMPNSFTPNADGLNDKFKPTISQPLAAYRFTIYNRYGQTIFTTTDQNKGWDGTYKESKQPMGGYIYYCTYRFNGGTEKMVKGYFMLLR